MRPMDEYERIADEILSRAGDGVRVVGTYGPDEYELLYVRDDVAAKLTDEFEERIHQDLVLRDLGKEHVEDLFDNGELRCTAYRFAETKVYHHVCDDTGGLLVTTDPDVEFRLDDFHDLCTRLR